MLNLNYILWEDPYHQHHFGPPTGMQVPLSCIIHELKSAVGTNANDSIQVSSKEQLQLTPHESSPLRVCSFDEKVLN
jgi:hypothetical protein